MIDFLVWLGLGFSLGDWLYSLLHDEELDDVISSQMFALLCVLVGLFI